jgi:uncharacterized protein (TIGR01244 family)
MTGHSHGADRQEVEMSINSINPGLSESSQIVPDDMAAVAEAGFCSVTRSRPDGERAARPAFADIQLGARVAGLQAAHPPLLAGQVNAHRALQPACRQAMLRGKEWMAKPQTAG